MRFYAGPCSSQRGVTHSALARLSSTGITNAVKTQPHNYAIVQEWDGRRTREISAKLKPYIQVTDAYAELVCEIVDVIGTEKPSSTQDVVVRDLLADVFDALHESRRMILTGKCSTAYPVARRVYESLSLMVLCALDADIAAKWDSGQKISNSDVGRKLAKHPFGETQDSTKKLYDFFSLGAHPNRDLIPHRFLGEGNEFFLGSIPIPSMCLVTEYCLIHLRMWFWFTAVLLHYYQRLIDVARPDFGQRYLRVADLAQRLQGALDQDYNRLLREEQTRYSKPP